MTTVPESQLVAWCAGCLWYLPAEEIGDPCPSPECNRKLRRRRGYVYRHTYSRCDGPEPYYGLWLRYHESIFWTRAEYLEHQREEHD